ncbi:MAG: hypothetical protein JNL98_04500 [Bryobacterales bacterium]|nr:hypothetical protein [Bryobacterales bacterium]
MRSVAAVALGFVSMMVVVAAMFGAARLFPKVNHAGFPFLAFNLSFDLMSGALGGAIATLIGKQPKHGLILAALVLVLGIGDFLANYNLRPVAFSAVRMLLIPCAVIAGSRFMLKP